MKEVTQTVLTRQSESATPSLPTTGQVICELKPPVGDGWQLVNFQAVPTVTRVHSAAGIGAMGIDVFAAWERTVIEQALERPKE